ncbi:MAG: phosphoribosylanthranilate isomerase [Pseudomonadota bacterium]
MDLMRVKICGLKSVEVVEAAARAGAAYIGLTHVEKSPRYVTLTAAKTLAEAAPEGLCKVMLLVDPSDTLLDQVMADVPIDMIQLHGGETPERVSEIKTKMGLPVMKAVGIADESDLPKIAEYSYVADQILVDAKPPKGSEITGGNGITFDWRLIAGRRWAVPWMLAGGLMPENVAEAVRLTGANQVDVSSGVESAPGVKDPGLIADFVTAAEG